MSNYFEQKVLVLSEIGYGESEQETWPEIIERLERIGYLTENFTPTRAGNMLHNLWYLDKHMQIIYNLDRGDFLDEDEEQELMDFLIEGEQE